MRDEETELYYNRFRYYDSQQGQYTQQDPIGLAGGNPTLYGYVYDTNIELDLLGLLKFGEIYVLTKLYLMVYQLNYQEEI